MSTRDADMELLNLGLSTLTMRGERFTLLTVGPLEKLSNNFPRTAIDEGDEYAQTAALLRADVFLSTQRRAPVDLFAVRALDGGVLADFARGRGLYGDNPQEVSQ